MSRRHDFIDGFTPTSGDRTAAGGFLLLATVVLAAFLMAGCYEQTFVPAEESNERLTITNDEASLEGRVDYTDEDIPLTAVTLLAASGPSLAPARAPSSLRLRLVADVSPPSVDGQEVQATSVWATRDDRAIVSYNVRGSTAVGALDYFTHLTHNRPRLRSSASFVNADVSAVFTDGRYAYAAAAASNEDLTAPAVLDRLGINSGGHFTLSGYQRVQLTSFTATSATSTGRTIYATSGDAGGLFAFDEGDMGPLGTWALDDARWVALDEDGDRVVVLQGTPGRLAVFDADGSTLEPITTFSVPGVDVAESKSTVEIAGRKAFVAAGPEGVQVVCLDSGEVVGSMPVPDPGSLGLDPSVVVTNAVTVDDDLMFISNGEAGVYAAAVDEDFDATGCSEPQNIQMLGRLGFEDLESVNHVVYRDGYLFVAAGRGGLKIVQVDAR